MKPEIHVALESARNLNKLDKGKVLEQIRDNGYFTLGSGDSVRLLVASRATPSHHINLGIVPIDDRVEVTTGPMDELSTHVGENITRVTLLGLLPSSEVYRTMLQRRRELVLAGEPVDESLGVQEREELASQAQRFLRRPSYADLLHAGLDASDIGVVWLFTGFPKGTTLTREEFDMVRRA
jgi:hypothetical protein